MRRYLVALMPVVLLLVFAGWAQECKQSDLQKQAKVTEAQATKLVMERVPGGAIKECELEKEKGKLVWSFDISNPKTKDITEVQVDAKTGEVVSVETESAASEAREKKKEAAKPKH